MFTHSVTVATVGRPITSLGSFPLETPLRLFGLGGTDSVQVVTTAGNDNISSSNSGLVINGFSLILDSIEATALAGGAGNDTYRFDADSFLGLISLDDAAGLDTLDFSGTTTTGITINLGIATNQAVNANLSLNLKSTSAFDTVIGGAGSDFILGNAVANLLSGEAGNDTINGGSGNDTLSGNGGDDSLDGGAGNDVYAFDADQTLGFDKLSDASGTELIDFSTTSAAVSLNLGSTLVQTVNGNLSIQLTASTTFDNVTGGDGNDIITGNAGINTLVGGDGNDSLDGAAGNDIYLFDADSPLGSDVLTDAVGTELISFAGTTAGVALNLGVTTLQTVNGSLSLTLASATQFDNIQGGNGNDSLIGNALVNSLTGDAGNDTLAGAAGNDTYVFDTDTALGSDTVSEVLNQGTDTLSFTLTTTKIVSANLGLTTPQIVNSNLTLTLTSGTTLENILAGSFGSNLIGNSLGNTLTGGNGADSLDGGSGNDSLIGGVGNDTLIGGIGNDVLTDAAGNDSMQGGSGDDRYLMDADAALGANTIDETAGGTDILEFNLTTTRSIVLNLAATDPQVINPNLTLTLVSGTSLENVLGGSLDDVITGNTLNNTLTGNAGHDVLNGDDGDDILIGGAGNDTLSGGLHNDVYQFDADVAPGLGADLVSDSDGADTLDFALTTTLGLTLLNLNTTTTQVLNANHSLILQAGTIIESVLGTAKDDVIIGNYADNILVGNAGNDHLDGGEGRDILIGGLGSDILLGGNDDDILVAGKTSHDTLIRNLNDLRTEWTSGNSYNVRRGNLFAGVGATGASLKAKINVLNDTSAKDTITGGAGEDWFFRALDDVLVDLFAGEQVDLL